MMIFLGSLWLPILVSAVVVFLASNVMHMLLKFWHYPDYKRTDDDKPFVEGSRGLKPGMYMFPRFDYKTATPEEHAAWAAGPSGIMYIRNPAKFSFGKTLTLWFLYCIVAGIFTAYISHETMPVGTAFRQVLQVAGATATIFWAFGTNFSDVIWYGKPWPAAIKYAIDGLIYGLLTGAVFAWLWPR
jgi:hypothetical protein